MKNILMKKNKSKRSLIKKICCSILFAVMFLNITLFAFGSKQRDEIIFKLGSNVIYLDNVKTKMDSKPIIRNGRTLVPVRFLVEAIGGQVDWNGVESKVTIVVEDKFIELIINKKKCTINEKEIQMDTAPIIYNKRTFLPVRFICETIGYDVSWNGSTKKITILNKQVDQGEYYVVKDGDTLFNISKRYNVKVNNLKEFNNIPNSTIRIGEKIYLSGIKEETQENKDKQNSKIDTIKKDPINKAAKKGRIAYTVKKGDTLSNIAKKYGVTTKSIKDRNKLFGDKILIDQKLYLDFSNISLIKGNNKDLIYYSQKDPRWKDKMYSVTNNKEQTIGTSGCGPTAMAIVVSNLSSEKLNPVKACELSIKYGFRKKNTGTKSLMFEKISDLYKIKIEKYKTSEIDKVEELVGANDKLAIVLMGVGHFTEVGHYIVIYGTKTINNEKYFEVLDPNTPNQYYSKYNDNKITDYDPKDGYVLVKKELLVNEVASYGGYSVFSS